MSLLTLQGDLHPICALVFAIPPLFKKHSPQSLAAQKMRLLALFVYFLHKKVQMFCVNVSFIDCK